MPTRAARPLRLHLLLLAPLCLLPVACGDSGGGETPADMTAAPDLRPRDCTSPCACPDRGPPDYSKAKMFTHAPSSDEDQKTAVERANYFRASVGLVPFNGADLINKAATNHSHYLSSNSQKQCYPDTPHAEDSMCPGYTGDSVFDRLTTVGYKYVSASEVINNGPLDPTSAVDWWIWSVYHRLPFVDYKLTETGFGVSNHWVMNFGTPVGAKPVAPGIIVFPVPGQVQVPADFAGYTESPTPPAPGGGGAWPNGVNSGQVISIHFATLGAKITEHHLWNAGASCAEVEHTYFDEQSDPNLAGSHAAFLYANSRLDDNTEYVAQFKGTYKGQDFERTWAFTTQ